MITNMDKQIKLSKKRNFRVSSKAILSHFNFVYRNQKLWMLPECGAISRSLSCVWYYLMIIVMCVYMCDFELINLFFFSFLRNRTKSFITK